MQGPDEILELPGPKKFWVAWRMSKKRISRENNSRKTKIRSMTVKQYQYTSHIHKEYELLAVLKHSLKFIKKLTYTNA